MAIIFTLKIKETGQDLNEQLEEILRQNPPDRYKRWETKEYPEGKLAGECHLLDYVSLSDGLNAWNAINSWANLPDVAQKLFLSDVNGVQAVALRQTL